MLNDVKINSINDQIYLKNCINETAKFIEILNPI